MSISELSAAKLVELGGLKTLCSAPLRCVAHGLAVPCDACEMEGTIGVVCEACGHHFPQGLLEDRNRACESQAEFARTGKIAFAKEATAALQALELERQREAKEAKEAKERQAVELARLERKRLEEKRVERERANRERTERERRDADIPLPRPVTPGAPVPPAPSGGGMSLAKWMVSAAVGGLIFAVAQHLWHDKGHAENFPVTATNPLIVEQKQPAPGIQKNVTPGTKETKFPRCAGSYEPKKCEAFEESLLHEDHVTKVARIEKLEQARQSAMSEVMAEKQRTVPTPSPVKGEEMTSSVPLSATTYGKNQIPDVRPTASNALSGIVNAVKAHIITIFGHATQKVSDKDTEQRNMDRTIKSLLSSYAIEAAQVQINKMLSGSRERNGAKIDDGVNALRRLQQPARGDRKIARRANGQGLQAIRQGQFVESIGFLTEAAKADPLDVEVLNNLAFALHKNGRLLESRNVALCALLLSPTRSSAWAELGTVLAQEKKEDLAVAALMLTFRFSQNQQRTRDALNGYIADKSDPLVQGAASKALYEIDRH